MSYPNEVGPVGASRPLSPTDAAFNDVQSMQGQISHTIDVLTDRLAVVLGPSQPQPDTKSKAEPAPPASQIVGTILDMADRERYHARRLQDLIDRLTI